MDTSNGRIEYLTAEEARLREQQAIVALQKGLLPKSVNMLELEAKDKQLADELYGKNRAKRRAWLKSKKNRERLRLSLTVGADQTKGK